MAGGGVAAWLRAERTRELAYQDLAQQIRGVSTSHESSKRYKNCLHGVLGAEAGRPPLASQP